MAKFLERYPSEKGNQMPLIEWSEHSSFLPLHPWPVWLHTRHPCSRCRYCRTYNNKNIPADKRLAAIQVHAWQELRSQAVTDLSVMLICVVVRA